MGQANNRGTKEARVTAAIKREMPKLFTGLLDSMHSQFTPDRHYELNGLLPGQVWVSDVERYIQRKARATRVT